MRKFIGVVPDPDLRIEVWESDDGPIKCVRCQCSVPNGDVHTEVIAYEIDGEFKVSKWDSKYCVRDGHEWRQRVRDESASPTERD